MSYGAAGSAYNTASRGFQRQNGAVPVSAGQAGARAYTAPMSRMLFLRDLQVDIQMRCRGCGHDAVLARHDLERRFGPNYPVLSIGPHYRCSRCNSREVESAPAGASVLQAAEAPAEDFSGALGALQGLLDSMRAGPHAADDVHDLMGDDLLDTMVEEPAGEPPAPPPDNRRLEEAGDEEFDELFSKLAAVRTHDHARDDEEDQDLPEAPPPPPPPPPASADSPFDETLAALRALTADDDDDWADDATEDGADQHRTGRGGEDDWADDSDAEAEGEAHPLYDEHAEALDEGPGALDDIPDEEILSFAIRDPDARGRAAVGSDAMDDAPRRPLAAGDEEEEEGEPLDLAHYRRPPPEHGSLDESLAALRALVEKAAAEPEPEPRKRTRHRPAASDGVDAAPPPAVPSTPTPAPPAPPVRTAQEKSLEDTLAQLRGMLDLDKDTGEEGEPVIKPRRR